MKKYRLILLRDKLLDVIPLLKEYFGEKPLLAQIRLITILETIEDQIKKMTGDQRHPEGD